MKSLLLQSFSASLLFAATLAPVGCDDDDDDSGSGDETRGGAEGGTTQGTTTGSAEGEDTGTTDGAEGTTPCSPPGLNTVCQAGQYCEDAVLAICTNGCLSNDNCASDQTCIKEPGMDVGSCQNMLDDVSQADFCEKMLTCDVSGEITAEYCGLIYAGTNSTCHNCVMGGNCGDLSAGTCDSSCGLSD